MTSGDVPTARTRTAAPIVLDRYRLRRRLGAGAFGTVWLARDERLERDVAVKILPRDRIADGRFEREARAAARLSHPAIVTLYEAAVDEEGGYLVSEFVEGATLGALLSEGRLSDRDVLEIGLALCDALAHAHAHGIVHRDVKPSNVLVPAAPAHVAKLTDFGVARLAGGDALTLTGDVLGTRDYMPPEQAEGREAGPAADVYALALVLYEALTGVNPAAGGGALTITGRTRRAGVQVPPLRRQRRDLPRRLGEGIDLALWPHPGQRGTTAELRAALEEARALVADEPGIVEGPPTLATLVRPWRPSSEALQEDHDGAWRNQPPPAPGSARASGGAAAGFIGPDGSRRRPWPRRAAAAAAAGALVGWLVSSALVPAAVAPAVAGWAATAAVLLLPRLGWMALTVVLPVAVAVQGNTGPAVLVAIALLVPAILLPLRPTLWPLLAVAPALGLMGVAGLAGAWPGLAASAGTAWRRAMLALGGWIWLLLGAPLAGRELYLPAPAPAAPTPVQHVLVPIVTSGVLAGGLVWALAASVLPWLLAVSPRLGPQVLLAAAWAAATTTALGPALRLATEPGHAFAGPAPDVLIVGAIAAFAAALAPVARFRPARGSTLPRLS